MSLRPSRDSGRRVLCGLTTRRARRRIGPARSVGPSDAITPEEIFELGRRKAHDVYAWAQREGWTTEWASEQELRVYARWQADCAAFADETMIAVDPDLYRSEYVEGFVAGWRTIRR